MSPDNNPEASTSKSQSWRGMTVAVVVVAIAIIVAVLFGQQQNPQIIIQLLGNFLPKNVLSASPSGEAEVPTVWTITPNSTGLRVDAAIYEQYLGSHESMLEQPPPQKSKEQTSSSTCVYIFLEVTPTTAKADMHQEWATFSRPAIQHQCRVMAMANTDQFTTEVLDFPHLELILCKTRQCVSWVSQKQEEVKSPSSKRIPMLYTGFTSVAPSNTEAISSGNDDIERFNRFIHVAGSSPHKGTWNVLQAWLDNPQWPTLTLTSYNNQMVDIIVKQYKQQLGIAKLPPNIQHLNRRFSRKEMDRMMRSHGVHLCLSGMEGFGHYINEARAVGALVLAPNYPAMNELVTSSEIGVLLEPSNFMEWANGLQFANVGAPELQRVMNEVVLPMSVIERNARGQRARVAYEEDEMRFQERMKKFHCYVQKCDPREAKSNNQASFDQYECAKACGLELE